jgi:hypothetical protein
MSLTFRPLATLTSLLFFGIAATWMFAPDSMLATWDVALSYPVELVGRRAAALYAGIGVMFFLARSTAPSPARSALAAGMVTACLLLAALGVFELVTGHAGAGILTAVLLEVALALAFIFIRKKS